MDQEESKRKEKKKKRMGHMDPVNFIREHFAELLPYLNSSINKAIKTTAAKLNAHVITVAQLKNSKVMKNNFTKDELENQTEEGTIKSFAELVQGYKAVQAGLKSIGQDLTLDEIYDKPLINLNAIAKAAVEKEPATEDEKKEVEKLRDSTVFNAEQKYRDDVVNIQNVANKNIQDLERKRHEAALARDKVKQALDDAKSVTVTLGKKNTKKKADDRVAAITAAEAAVKKAEGDYDALDKSVTAAEEKIKTTIDGETKNKDATTTAIKALPLKDVRKNIYDNRKTKEENEIKNALNTDQKEMKELETKFPAGKKITNYAFSEDAAVIEPNVHIVGVPLSDEELNAVLQPKK